MIPATGIIDFGLIGILFTVAAVGVMALNAFVWRFLGRKAIVSAAFYLAAVYLAAEVAQFLAYAYVPRPWAMLIAIPADVLLLLMCRDIWAESKDRWAKYAAWTLFGGVMLQVWAWAMVVLEMARVGSEKYTWAEYRTYTTYANISTILGGVELALFSWPGIRRGLVVLPDRLRALGLWSRARHAGAQSVSNGSKARG